MCTISCCYEVMLKSLINDGVDIARHDKFNAFTSPSPPGYIIKQAKKQKHKIEGSLDNLDDRHSFFLPPVN